MRFLSLLLAVFVLAGMAAAPPAAPALATWKKLGERTVDHALDRDEIKVGVREGDFRSIKLVVKRRAVTFRDVKVHYRNGGVQDVALRREIGGGGETRVIDLKGDDRFIQKVVFWYNTAPHRGRRAKVVLYGQR
ncbi:MAG: hypothetical protein R3247_08895 [Rhodothermales bacterium]|nr:hypothetical protein [Rhodothermales bacterium]